MEQIGRFLALDIGTKRIGTAISDPFGLFATELELIQRTPETLAIKRIRELAKSYQVKKIIAGVPYNSEGEIGEQAKDCINFAKNFEDEFEIIYVDETLTSSEAEKLLQKEKKRYTKNKGLVDLKAAALILTDYLNSRSI